LGLLIEIFCSKKGTQHTNKITKQILFLDFGYLVNVRINFGSRQTQTGIHGIISHSVPCVAVGQSALLALVVL